jgi:hypothetical protein
MIAITTGPRARHRREPLSNPARNYSVTGMPGSPSGRSAATITCAIDASVFGEIERSGKYLSWGTE